MSNLTRRVLTAAFLIPPVVWVSYLGGFPYVLVVMLFVGFGVNEFYDFISAKGARSQRLFGTIAAVAVAFGRFLGVLVPSMTPDVFLDLGSFAMPGGRIQLGLSPQRVVAVLMVAILTAVNIRGVRLPKSVLDLAGIDAGDNVQITVNDRQMVVTRVARPNYALAELMARIPRCYKAAEVDFRPSVGKEAW